MVIDTMVFVYAALHVAPFFENATRAIERAPDIFVPDSFHAEFANVLWQWVAKKGVEIQRANQILSDVQPLISLAVPAPALWVEALRLSVERNHPVYDTLFVALAIAESTQMVTFDQPMLKRFPEYAISADSFVNLPD